MRWSWRIGQIAGIGVYMHFTFIILLAWVVLSHILQGHSWAVAFGGLAFIICLFSIIVLHELGHALTARRFGIQTRDITLLPIGGVARLERMPDDPRQELLVAIAGPLVNVALALLLGIIVSLTSGPGAITDVAFIDGNFLVKLLWVNIVLVLFNMIPAFPMDGGRVLRALLAMRMNYVRATQIAAEIGQAISLIFGFVGLFFNPFLVFIALFVWIGAAEEAAMVQVKYALSNIPISQAMITEFRTLSPDDPLELAVGYILAGFQQDFPVVENGELVGVLRRADLPAALEHGGSDMPVRDAMCRDLQTADPRDMLDRVFSRLQENHGDTLPVVRNGHLLGLITADNLGEFLLVQNARNGRNDFRRSIVS